MIDRGLLATMALIFGVVAIADRLLRRRLADREPVLALASTPVMIGIAIGRLAAVVQDDPATLRRPFDLLLLRGGMEFWPGVAAAVAAVWLATRRGPSRPQERLAELAPFALWAYAAYEAACLLRDGCFGPSSRLGLRPGGIGEPQLPVGVLVGVSAAALGVAVWRWSTTLRPLGVITLSVAGLAAIRAAAGFLLPKVTAGLTRAHRESITVLSISLLLGAALLARSTLRSRGAEGHVGVEHAAGGLLEHESPSHRPPAASAGR